MTTGFEANGTEIRASASIGKYIINGDSHLTNGAKLSEPLLGKNPPKGLPIENNGTMTLVGSKVLVSALSGKGSIKASGNSSLDIQSATSG
ncbi:MAG: hypothetical protein ACJ8AW_34970 [Rhodopila sp.]